MTELTMESYLEDLRMRQRASRPAGASDEVDYPLGHLTLPQHVEYWATVRPDTTAVVDDTQFLTYAQLDDAHRRVATWLSERGVRAGDRVAVHLGNRHEFVVAFLAILRLGAVHVPVNPMFSGPEIAYELRDSEAALLISSQAFETNVAAAFDNLGTRLPTLMVESDWDAALTSNPYLGDEGTWVGLAALNYTGGTTGMPKGCMHAQRDMVYTAASTAAASALKADGTFSALCFLPIFWIAGEDLGIIFPLVLGGTSVLMSRWNAERALNLIEQYRVTAMVGTVESYLELIARDDIADRDLSSLTDPQAVSFVRKLTVDVRQHWARVAPKAGVLREAAYGMTETNTMDTTPYGLHRDDLDLLSEPVFCGLPVPGTDVAVVEFGTETPLPNGDVGEIIVRSPAVTSGYWRNEEATRQQLVDGWIHTGDNGRIDEHGFVHYLGRAKEMIKVNGMSVFPAEVEMTLAAHPAVTACAVAPIPDAVKGEQPVAFVTLAGGDDITVDELEQWCRQRLAGYKVPRIERVEAMPMTATGKIRKNVLTERLEA